jgi:(2Fe-2S) ferredoxin
MNNKELARKAKQKGVGPDKNGDKSHHLLLCTGPNCLPETGAKTLRTFKKGCKTLRENGVCVYVTEVKCLRLCRLGPLAVVYPEGVWYSNVTPENATRIMNEHLQRGEIVEELAFLKNPLQDEKK